MPISFERLWVLLLLPAGALALLILAWPSRRRRSTWLAVLVRLVMLSLVLVALAGPVGVARGSTATRQVVLVDRSASVGQAALDAAQPILGDLSAPQSLVLQFAERPQVVTDPGRPWPAPDAADRVTDLERALRFAGDLLAAPGAPTGDPPESGSILLLSDGLATTGDALSAAADLAAQGVRVDVLPVSGLTTTLDVGIEAVSMPVAVWARDPFSVTVSLYASDAVPAFISLERDGIIVTEISLNLDAGENHVAFSLEADAPGLSALTARVVVRGDRRLQNDRLGAIALVQPPPNALIVAHRPDAGLRLQAALAERRLTAQVVDAAGLAASADALLPYQLVILEDISAETLTVEQLAALKAYVYAYGRGLIVFGGPSAYTLGGYAGTALEDLLPVKLEAPQHVERPPASLVLILDHSQSMEGLKLQLVKEAAMRAVEILHLRDRIGILSFNHTYEWSVPLSPLGAGLTVRQALDSIGAIQPVGGTNLLDPLRVAIEAMLAERFGQQHIVLLTDGISGVGTRPEFQALVEQAINANITVSSIAVGADADAELLALIAEWGQGRFRVAVRPTDIPRMIVAETQYAASDLIQRGLIQPQIAMAHPMVSNFVAADFPPLAGHVALLPRPVSEADTVLVTPLEDPLLAAWQYGLGRVIAWTSDAAREWGPAWANWDQLGRFWVQLVRYALPDPSFGPVIAQAQVRGSTVNLTVLATGADGRGLNLAEGQLRFNAPDGTSAGVVLAQTAPGEYGAAFDLSIAGAYRGLVSLEKDGQHWEVPVGFVVGYSPEYSPRLSSGVAALQQIAALTGGRTLTSAAGAALVPEARAEAGAASYAPWLLLAAVLAWPLEIAIRRRWRPWH